MDKSINIDSAQLFQAVLVIDKFMNKLNSIHPIIDNSMKQQIYGDIIHKYNFWLLDEETIQKSKIVR
jgi:hypothetical protein